MCGICGEFRFDKTLVKKSHLQNMCSELIRRGPDFGDIYIDGTLGFGHRRLAIIDLSEKANQPMVDRKLNLSLVFNGTIYNYRALREKLSGYNYQFFSHSDSEIIIKAYHRWGENCVNYFDGMFAFALWDANKKKLFLTRDRMGIKPLYYTLDNKSIRFASNTKALLNTNTKLDKSINPVALRYQLSLHGVVPAPHTIINGIQKLKPAHYMTLSQDKKVKTKCYWHPSATRIKPAISAEEYIEKTHYLLKKAVLKRMLAADVKTGVLLSGGLDSSLIVALLAELGEKNIYTFSIGFEDIDDEVGNEFIYSDKIAQQFNTQHEKYKISNSETLARLPEAVAQMAEPMVAQDAVAFYLLSEQVSKSVKVVQSGQGADEAFAGYFWYPKMQDEKGTDVMRFSKHYIDRPELEYSQTINENYQTSNVVDNWLHKQFAQANTDEFLDKVLRTDITHLIVDDPIKRVDNMTMAWGLEARVPFMDTSLVEWALSIPPALKLKEKGKYPLKQIARKLLPANIINREKAYFPMPALKYIRHEFLDFMRDILTSKACRARGIFNENYIQKLLKNPKHYMTALNGSRLTHLALLELWFQIHLDTTS